MAPIARRIYVVARSAACWFLLALATCLIVPPYLIATAGSPAGGLARKVERLWCWFILWASRVRLSVRGLEHVQPGRSYVVMSNHLSLYDIPVLHYLLGRDRDLRWVGKQELLKIPLFGLGFARSRHIAIDRQNRSRSIAALKEAASASVEGISFAIMPEGTRSPDGRLGPFKKGGFHLAIDTGLPILPVVILGSDELMRKGSWHILPGSIEARVLSPITVGGLDKGDVDMLLALTRSAIESELEGRAPETVERSRR